MKLAILSDLHCHHSSCEPQDTFLLTDALRHPINQHPVEALLKMICEKCLTADYLVMLGDLTNRVDIQGLISGWKFIEEIALALKVKDIIVTVGNHDVDIRNMHKMGNPNHVAQNFNHSFPFLDEGAKKKFWSDGYVVLHPENAVCFVIINSTHSNITDTQVKRGSVSDVILEAIDSEIVSIQSDLKIMVCHHHPLLHSDVGWSEDHVMLNGERLVALAEKHKFSIILHGHKHYPRITKSSGISGLPVPVFAAGSFSAMIKGNLATVTRNQFHLVEFSSNTPVQGLIRSWEYGIASGWEKTVYRSSGFPSRTGFGFQGSIPALSTAIADFYKTAGQALLSWSIVEAQYPETRYLSPVELRVLAQHLAMTSLEIDPEPPNTPKSIGKIV